MNSIKTTQIQKTEFEHPASGRTVIGDRSCIEIEGLKLFFECPNKTTRWRVESFFRKEPETIRWIDTFTDQDLFIDVGANVGMYSIYAGARSKSTVLAFEPESQNFSLLNTNIYLNRLDSRVQAIPVSISNEIKLDTFNLSTWGSGESCHSVGEPIDFKGMPFKPSFVQGTYKITLDSISARLASFKDTHLKIDVDGLEPDVISGAGELLHTRSLASLLIEINHNLDSHINVIRTLLRAGYLFDPIQVKSSLRSTGPFAGVANYVFYRS